MKKIEGVVNEISKLRNTALSPHSLNTIMAIVMSSPAKPTEMGFQPEPAIYQQRAEYGRKWHKVPIMVKWKTRKGLVR